MSWSQELSSWLFPSNLSLSKPPEAGEQAPTCDQLVFPCGDGKPAIVSFLRHCGCPWAEKSFRNMRSAAEHNPNIHFIAISHSTPEHTERWLQVLGGAGPVSIIVDHERTLYAKWGLGASTWWHLLSPFAFWNVYKLGRSEGIRVRSTESGSRWQQAGMWAIDGRGRIIWGRPADRSDEVADVGVAVKIIS